MNYSKHLFIESDASCPGCGCLDEFSHSLVRITEEEIIKRLLKKECKYVDVKLMCSNCEEIYEHRVEKDDIRNDKNCADADADGIGVNDDY